MKFEINGAEFKNLVGRISALVPKKSSLYFLECVKITADGNYVTLQASDSNDYGTIKVRANVFESGCAWIHITDLNKVIGISDYITITANNARFEVRSKKKSYEVKYYDYSDEQYEYLDTKNNPMCLLGDMHLLNHLSKLDCMRESSNIGNPLIQSFCLDLPKGKIVALNGHMVGVANISGTIINPAKPLNISGTIYKKIKSIIGKTKTENTVAISADDKVVKFAGEDWTLVSRLIDGKFWDYEHLFNGDYDYSYRIDHNELKNIAKEYAKAIGREKIPMIIYSKNGMVATGVQVGNYKTSDLLQIVNPEYGMENEEFSQGFNASYIYNTCNVFDDEAVVKGSYKRTSPIVFENETYKVMILPVNIGDHEIGFVEKQIA